MIPQFPQFKSIEQSDRAGVDAHTSQYDPYTDFNFNCLWSWDELSKRMISELNGNLVVKFTDYATYEPFLSFLGANDQEGTTRALIEYCKSESLPTTLRLMPEVSVDGLDPSMFAIEESRGDFDYIFSTQEHADLPGGKFQKKRSEANRFWRENPSGRFDLIDMGDPEVQKQIIETIEVWEQNKIAQNKDYEIAHELTATRRLLNTDRPDVLCGAGLYIEKKMIGYAIGEELPNKYALVHFMKSTNAQKGGSEALMQAYAKYLLSRQCEYMNFESDLGFEYVRRHKMSLRPVKFLKRYDVHYSQK